MNRSYGVVVLDNGKSTAATGWSIPLPSLRSETVRRLRFGLKTILFLTSVIAVFCCTYREYQHHLQRVRLRQIRDGFLQWSERTDRSDGKFHSYFLLNSAVDLNIVTHPGTRQAFFVANVPMTHQRSRTPELIFRPQASGPDEKRFYVLPSNKWVNTAEEVIDEWDAWHRVKY